MEAEGKRMSAIDIAGKRYGRLQVISRTNNNRQGTARWACRCDCGAQITILGSSLRNGHTKSCGCLQSERARDANTKHGAYLTPEYRVWCGIHRRCNDKKDGAFKNYGGRGITVCKRWDNFSKFFADMGERPSAKHTIERIDNDNGYFPKNCEWATRKAQCRNRRISRYYKIHGERLYVVDAYQRYAVTGISYKRFCTRIRRDGWGVMRALTTPITKRVCHGAT
jgi:hypothetical protein